jgi:hypothetical protein
MRNLSRFLVLVVVAALVALASGCEYGELGAVSGPSLADFDTVGLTHDPGDVYVIAGDSGYLSVSADSRNVGGNTRIGVGFAGVSPGNVVTLCATWNGDTSPVAQEGLMLGWSGGRGVTFTKNIWAGASWVINLHWWEGTSFTLLAGWDVPVLHGNGFPLRFCARRYAGAVEFKVWPAGWPEPAWGSDCCGARFVVDREWGAGINGVYAGHLQAGHSLSYSFVNWE